MIIDIIIGTIAAITVTAIITEIVTKNEEEVL